MKFRKVGRAVKRNKIFLVFVGVLVLFTAGALGFLSLSYYPAAADVLARLEEDPAAAATAAGIEFWPPGAAAETGLIIYPGGNVDYKAYAPVAAAISRAGYLTVVVRMPLSLAVLGPNRGRQVMNTYPEIQTWILAGHSLGGVMAARFALENREQVAGLILWASYPDKDLSESGLQVLSHYATRDGILNAVRFQEAKPLLPPDTHYLPITGGNHAYFGSYGLQRGDLEAEISREEQQSQIVAAALAFLARIKNP